MATSSTSAKTEQPAKRERWIALTSINYRADGNSDNVHIPEGDEVKGLPREIMEDLYAAGSIVRESDLPTQPDATKELQDQVDGLVKENEDLKNRVVELEQQLAEANKKATPTK